MVGSTPRGGFDSPRGEVCEKAPSIRPSSHSNNHKNGQDAVSYCHNVYKNCLQDGVGTSPGENINSLKKKKLFSITGSVPVS